MKNKLILVHYCFLFLFFYPCQAIQISSLNEKILEKFFRTMVEDSEAGYVFYGHKPVCIHGFNARDYFLGENESHATSTYLREGAKHWKQITKGLAPQEIILHIYEVEDSLAKNCIHILFINRSLFHKTVQENLSLFQYVLGPDITSEKLLNRLIDPKEKFHTVLRNDKVLIGILLGFGTQNSLLVSRIENLEDALFSHEQIPFKSLISRLNNVRPEFLNLLLMRESDPNSSSIAPSFGFSSLKDEMLALNGSVEISSQQLSREKPLFIFGRLKNSSRELVEGLEQVQKKIQVLLTSLDFLKKVINIIFPNEPIFITAEKELFFQVSDHKNFSSLLAANIWEMIDEENEEFQKAFIEGMKDAEISEKEPVADLTNYYRLDAIRKIKQNLSQTEQFFESLDQDQNYTCLVPSMLYYKTLEEGSGRIFSDEVEAELHFVLRTPSGGILADTWTSGVPRKVNVKELIPGLIKGLQGMRVGEIREIIIHPNLAYGIYTTLEKGIYLKGSVQLVGLGKTKEKIILPDQLDKQITFSPHIESEYLAESVKVGFAQGYRTWQHYRKSGLVDLNQLLSSLKAIQAGKSVDIFSKENQDLINSIHWLCYEKSSNKKQQ